MLKKLVALVSLAGFVLGLAACNTMEGVGQDVQAGGKAIEKAADKNKPK
jgi:predicted small secreted protein